MARPKEDDHVKQAAAILREGAPLEPAEKAAEKVIKDNAWVLWHVKGSRDLAVARLLHRAGLLRDVEREEEAQRADASMRRLDRCDNAANRVMAATLSGLVDEAIRALHEGRDPGQLADQMEGAYQRATERAERARRGEEATK
jgi:hypothetical protein